MASAEGEVVENGVATVKQSELKLVQTVKKVTNLVESELILTENELSWKWQPVATATQTKGKDDNQTKGNKTNSVTEESVRVNWVLRAKVETAKATEKPEGEENGETTSELVIHYIRRHEQPEFRLSMAQVKFSGPTNICTEWETVLTDLLAKKAPQRPKSLLVIVNPASGYKKAEKIYRDKVAPIFEVAGITTEVVATKKPKDSSEILNNHDLAKFDGIVSVGGDGTHTEVSSALLEKTMKEGGVEEVTPTTVLQSPSIRHGMIPTGSGNGQQIGLTYSRDVATAALVIALGDSRRRSVAMIHCGEKLLAYSYLLIGYGFLSQIMEIMENNRWAGPARYLAVAFITLVKRKAAEVQLDYLPGDEESRADFEILSEIKPEKVNNKGSSVDPPAAGGADAEQKVTNQAEGTDAEQKSADQAEGADTEQKATSPAEGTDNGQKSADQAEVSNTEEKSTGQADGGNAGEATGEASSEQPKSDAAEIKSTEGEKGGEAAVGQEEEAAEDPLPEGWKRVCGKFIGIDCFLSRVDKLDYSRLYMVEESVDPSVLGLTITQPCGRIEHAKHMRRLQKGELRKCFTESGFAKILGVKAFNIKAIGEWRHSSKANAIDWDGDMLYCPEPHFEVRCQPEIVPTFARVDGPELKKICIQEEERKKAALQAEQEKKEQALKEKKEAAAAANNAKAAENEEKPSEGDGKPSDAETKPAETETKPAENEAKPAEGEVASEEAGQKEADENLPKAEVEIKVTEAPENDPQ